MLSTPLPLQTAETSNQGNNQTQQGSTQNHSETQGSQTSTSTNSEESALANSEDQKAQGSQTVEQAPKRLLSDDDIAGIGNAVAKAIPQQGTQQQQAQQRQFSQEEINQALKRYNPDAKFYERLSGGGEEGMKAVGELVSGLRAEYERRIELELAYFREQLAPQIQSVQQTSAAQEEDKFYSSNKDLDPHRDIVGLVYNTLSQKGKLSSMSRSEMYKTVAEEARAYCKSKGIPLTSTPANAGTSGTTTRKVPAKLNGTSQGGGQGGQSADSSTVAALRRF